jgi:hypothetical protein
MQGNFSKNPTAAYSDRVSRVLMQQGRVQLDSDWNEQAEAFLRLLRGLGSDVIGFHGGIGPDSFRIIAPPAGSNESPRIGWGCYYIDGLRCVNPRPGEFWDLIDDVQKFRAAGAGLLMTDQHDLFPLPQAQPQPGAAPPPRPKQLVYLDAFERHIASEQDDAIREVALLGPDTASRAVVVWQVRTLDFERFLAVQRDVIAANFPQWDPNYLALNLLLRPIGKMRAQAIVNQNLDPCIISPEARFRGDNRLYRVEIHDPGTADPKKPPKIKWSADNASIVYPIRTIEGHTLFLDSLGRDDRTTISVGDWVEAVNDEITLMGIVKPLLQVVAVDRARKSVTLSGNPGDDVAESRIDKRDVRPILRRWATNVVDLREGHAKENWIDLSDGVQVQFSGPTANAAKPRTRWRTGDYWLIPARSATGDVIWPQETGGPRPVGPHGIDHHYAPLAEWEANGAIGPDLRFLPQIAKPVLP